MIYLVIDNNGTFRQVDSDNERTTIIWEGWPWQQTPLTGLISNPGKYLITETKAKSNLAITKTQDGVFSESSITQADESLQEVRPSKAYLTTVPQQQGRQLECGHEMKKYNIQRPDGMERDVTVYERSRRTHTAVRTWGHTPTHTHGVTIRHQRVPWQPWQNEARCHQELFHQDSVKRKKC